MYVKRIDLQTHDGYVKVQVDNLTTQSVTIVVCVKINNYIRFVNN